MKYRLALVVLALLFPLSLPAQIETINWLTHANEAPSGGFSLIPDEQRTFFIAQSNYKTVGASFTITGGTIVSSLNGMVTVKAASTGASCKYDSTHKVVISSANVAITATPKDGGASAATLTVPICNPTPVHHNLPTFRLGVYKSQPVTLQCIVEGTMNKACSWRITANPGNAGSLSDTNQRDTVFTASAPGRYVVTSKADADSSAATTIIDIPNEAAMPYQVTPNGTEPVNCAADTNLKGTVYHVGPSQKYEDFTSFLAKAMPKPGDTILLSNQSSSRPTPTTLYNYMVLQSQGTQSQPIFFCGAPNAAGDLPVLDGTNATSSYPANQFFSGYGLVSLYNTAYSTSEAYPRFIQISGFVLQNANNTRNYQAAGNGHTSVNTWGSLPKPDNAINVQCPEGAAKCPSFVAAIRLQSGGDINIIGNEMRDVGMGIFTEAKSPMSKMTWRVLVEGNYIHDFGYSTTASSAGTGGVHALYMQSFEEVVQGNHFGNAHSTHKGGVIKDRGVVQFIRYNYLDNADTSSRNLDLVDQQDACYTNPIQAIACSGSSPIKATDPGFGWDELAGWQEAFNDESWFYGNIQLSKALGPVHYNGDHGKYTSAPRIGRLHYYNNTLICPAGCAAYDTMDPNGSVYAFPAIDVQNSILWMDGADSHRAPTISFLRGRTGIIHAVSLVTPRGAVTNDQMSANRWTPFTGWPGMTAVENVAYYADYNNLSAHISGFGSGGTVPNSEDKRPYNVNTFSSAIPGTVLPKDYLPVRFQFRPDLGYVTARKTTVNATAAGSVGAVDGQ